MTGNGSIGTISAELEILGKSKREYEGDVDMTINKEVTQTELKITLEGRLDTSTAPVLDAELKKSIEDKEKLILDFAGIEYISSAGLRVLLSAQKIMNKQGSMVIINVNDAVMEVFEITGFNDMLTIE